VSGTSATPVAYHLRCESVEISGHNVNDTPAGILRAARTEPVAVLIPAGAAPPRYARTWTAYPLHGLSAHAGMRAYVAVPPHRSGA
jgi:hypothetical protein